MNEEKNEPFDQNESKQMKKTNPLLLVVCAIVIVLVAIAGYYFSKVNSARYIFDKKIMELLSSESEVEDYNTLKTNTEIAINIETVEETFLDELIDFINNSKLSVKAEIDKESEEAIVGIKLDNNRKNLLDANMKLEMESQEAYVNLGNLLDKTIKVDASEILDEEFDFASTESLTFGQKINATKARNILKSEIQKELSNEYFSSEKVTINNEKLTKDTLKISEEELVQVIKNICNNLMINKEFLECFEDEEDIKDSLQKIVDELEEQETYEDVIIKIDVYSKGLLKAVQRVDISIEDEEEKYSVQIKKSEEDVYEYIINSDEEEITGTVKYTKSGNDILFNIVSDMEDVKITLQINVSKTYDESLTNINTRNAVDVDDLTDEDMEELYENFMDSDLYESISSMISPLLFGSSYDNDDFSYNFYDDEEDEDDEEETNTTKLTSNLSENEIKTYDDDVIKFEVPEGFEEYSEGSSEHYRLFQKEVRNGTVNVDISAEYDTIDEYIENIQNKVDSYSEEENYINVQVSDVSEVKVKENVFQKITFSYDYKYSDGETVKHATTYYACEIDKNNLYTVEVDNQDLIRNSDLEKFLSIEK